MLETKMPGIPLNIDDDDSRVSEPSEFTTGIPGSVEILTLIFSGVPLKLLVYHLALPRGDKVDKPTNPTETVSIE